MKTIIAALAALTILALGLPAVAAPDCSNIALDARVAGCHGVPDFAVNNGPQDDTDDRSDGFGRVIDIGGGGPVVRDDDKNDD